MKADPSGFWWRLGVHELFYRRDQNHDLFIVIAQFSIKFSDLSGEFLVPGDRFAELNKRADNEDAYFNRFGCVQHAGRHDGTVFGEGSRVDGLKFQFLQVVTVCYHLLFLLIYNHLFATNKQDTLLDFAYLDHRF